MIEGIAKEYKIYIDGKELPLEDSLKIWNKSPSGFSWGYQGSGCAQSALGILFHFTKSERISIHLMQKFKRDIIATLDFDQDFQLEKEVVTNWITDNYPLEWLERERKIDQEIKSMDYNLNKL